MMLWRIPRCRILPDGETVVRNTTVIIPARNEENNLPRLLESLNRQRVAPQRILVVDDHSE
ncbi:MAG: glycosyltransferase, partial [Chitinivibrionales bacterium]|nr:glycosyltransferase [Chitinivibrionales bacterium]